MPRKEIDYSKCLIYKIQHLENDKLLYVGHTTNFTKRTYDHKYNAKHNKKYKVYEMIRNNGGWESFSMIKLYDYPCINLQEARTEEDKAMRELKSTLNNNQALQDIHKKLNREKLYRDANKEIMKEYNKKYQETENYRVSIKKSFEKNKQKNNAKARVKAECECGVMVNICCLKRHQRGSNCKFSAKYNFISDDKLEKINTGKSFKCDCGSIYTRKDRHIKTQKHIDFINNQIQT
jgi:hypothetical protein